MVRKGKTGIISGVYRVWKNCFAVFVDKVFMEFPYVVNVRLLFNNRDNFGQFTVGFRVINGNVAGVGIFAGRFETNALHLTGTWNAGVIAEKSGRQDAVKQNKRQGKYRVPCKTLLHLLESAGINRFHYDMRRQRTRYYTDKEICWKAGGHHENHAEADPSHGRNNKPYNDFGYGEGKAALRALAFPLF